MSQRDSGYERIERDCYETPEWVTWALLPHLPARLRIWEPACASGKMVSVLAKSHTVEASDIVTGTDFLKTKNSLGCTGIITNPPYSLAVQFVEHAIEETEWVVAMLLRATFDSGRTRRHLFEKNPAFSKKIVLTKRIVWFERDDGEPPAPSDVHAWFIWDKLHEGPATLAYAP